MLVGIRSAEIYLIDQSGKVQNMIKAHYAGEIHGLAVHPTEALAITSGSDNSIRVWDLLNNKILKQYDHHSEIIAIDWSKGGMFIAAGSIQGELVLFDS